MLASQRGSNLKVLKRPSLISQDQLLVERKHKTTSSKTKPAVLCFLLPISEVKSAFSTGSRPGLLQRMEQLLSIKLNMNK